MLASRHSFSMEEAFDIADNRISLLTCLRNRNAGERNEILAKVKSPNHVLLAGGLVLVAAPALAVLLPAQAPSIAPAAKVEAQSLFGADVRTNNRGEVLMVAGRDPRTVLKAYCAARPGAGLEPVDVIPAEHDGADARFGLFHATTDPTKVFLIEILEDRAGDRWVAGDGAKPIGTRIAPQVALGTREESPGPP
jgi:hypothetical protein